MGCLLLKSLIKIYNIQIPTKNLVGIFLFISMNIAIIGLGLIGGSIALYLGVYGKGETKFKLNKQNWIETKLIIK